MNRATAYTAACYALVVACGIFIAVCWFYSASA